MSKKINISTDTLADLVLFADQVGAKQREGSLPVYPDFVNGLFKPMDSVELETLHAATGIAGEAGEILDLIKKHFFYETPLDVEKLIGELGDLSFYLQAMLNLLELNHEDIQAANMGKLMTRYPDMKFSNEAAINRADVKGNNDA